MLYECRYHYVNPLVANGSKDDEIVERVEAPSDWEAKLFFATKHSVDVDHVEVKKLVPGRTE